MEVYTCFCTDVIHEGHLNVLKEASKYGKVTVGVLTDSQMIRYNRFPTKFTDERVQKYFCMILIWHPMNILMRMTENCLRILTT